MQELVAETHKTIEEHNEWLLDQTEKFCQDKAIYNAIMDGIQIIDGKGKLNENISQDITTWRRDFLFPRFNESIASEGITNKVGFINEMRTKGNVDNKRVRIFRKFNKNV